MTKRMIWIGCMVITIFQSCRKDPANEAPPIPVPVSEPVGKVLLADFETKAPGLYMSSAAMNYSVVSNPAPDAINASAKCGVIYTTSDKWELLYSEALDGNFEMLEDTVYFSMKVYTSVPGNLYLKIENATDWRAGQLESQMKVTEANKWVEVSFRFLKDDFQEKSFGKVVLLFDAGGEAVSVPWYFDDIRTPRIKPVLTVFEKIQIDPWLGIKPGSWYGLHVANVSILTPEETGSSQWKMYVRGTAGYGDGNHDDIGLFEQDATGFNPLGGWKENAASPVLVHGAPGSYDYRFILDGSLAADEDRTIYIYYKANEEASLPGSLNGAFSKDGGYSFTKFDNNPLKLWAGPNEIVYRDKTFYLYYGHDGKVWLSRSDKADVLDADPVPVIQKGEPGSFESYAVNGVKIFRVSGDSRWFLIYQCSTTHGDFPERFHAAYSDDLVHWTKAANTKPLFVRGKLGEWDQGAIWTGEVLEHNGSLYIYYEGWGKEGMVQDRNKDYFQEGRSEVGIARASVADFLEWINQ